MFMVRKCALGPQAHQFPVSTSPHNDGTKKDEIVDRPFFCSPHPSRGWIVHRLKSPDMPIMSFSVP
jgi:hypothetical protein